MFIVTWAIALSIWRYGRIEERWSAHLKDVRQTGSGQ
jgi:high-affinity nickel-transport protein